LCNYDGNPKIVKGEKTLICLVVSYFGNWYKEKIQYRRLIFQPKADTFSHFTITGSFNEVIKDSTKDTMIHVECQQSISELHMFYNQTGNPTGNPTEKFIFRDLTAIIEVDEGIVTAIKWDRACRNCPHNQREENIYNFHGNVTETYGKHHRACYLKKSQCESNDMSKEYCDVNIYFVWTGTDINGTALSSVNSRMSEFNSCPHHDQFMKDNPESNPIKGALAHLGNTSAPEDAPEEAVTARH